jgi:large repetitive protein
LVTVHVTNQGDGPTSINWTDSLALARLDPKLSPFGSQYGTVSFEAPTEPLPLGPGQSYSLTKSFTVPEVASGKWFLFGRADAFTGQPENDELNNTRGLSFTVLPPNVDLVVSAASAPATGDVGTSIPVTATITNQGTDTAGGSINRFDRIYLSDNETFEFSDRMLYERSASSNVPLIGGASYTFSANVTIPADVAAGNKFLVFLADSSAGQVETDNSNNLRAMPIEVRAPNLVITATTPATAVPNQLIPVSWTVRNDGVVTASADWLDRVYLSTDNQLDNNDNLLVSTTGAFAFTPLLAGASYTIGLQAAIPNVPLGDRFLLFVTDWDHRQGETDESDNVRALPITLG